MWINFLVEMNTTQKGLKGLKVIINFSLAFGCVSKNKVRY